MDLHRFVDLNDVQVIIHKIKLLASISTLHGFTSIVDGEKVQRYVMSFLSLVDFESSKLFGSTAVPVDILAGISWKDNQDDRAQIMLFFNTIGEDYSSVDSLLLSEFVKTSAKFEKKWAPNPTPLNLSNRKLAIVITERSYASRLLKDSDKILDDPSILTRE